MIRNNLCCWFSLGTLLALADYSLAQSMVDFTECTIVITAGELPAAEKVAPEILSQEAGRRCSRTWKVVTHAEKVSGATVHLATKAEHGVRSIPASCLTSPVMNKSEAYCIELIDADGPAPQLWIVGSDPRGVMFGVGQLLRDLRARHGNVSVPKDYRQATAPDKFIRGHQIGYRPRANSWDAWTVAQFDQYFRDMVVFGANCMENIPFQDDDPHPLMIVPREQMNIEFARLCMKYDLDHWLWVPVEFSVADEPDKGAEFLKRQAAFYSKCPRLDAIFVPGGDPGNNPSAKLLPYLEKMAAIAQKSHPNCKVWLSLQGFKGQDIDDFYKYIDDQQPKWFGGVVMGPSSPPMESTRARLPKQYPLRWYPDITHNVRCQYPIPWLDPVWGLTVGREGVNPRPQDYAAIYQNDYRLTDGFLSYTDGIHDDFNKNLWTSMAWDPQRPLRQIAAEYSRYFFGTDLAEIGVDAIFGLEANLRGPVETNGSIAGTLALWQKMDAQLDPVHRNWRFDMHLFRATYDAYTQARLVYERRLETEALKALSRAHEVGFQSAVTEAKDKLGMADKVRTRPDLLTKVEQLADRLFKTIGYQTSVEKYGASGYERGCMMDYLHYPLNNRWWIEDQIKAAEDLNDRTRLDKVDEIVHFEDPGLGGYYEAIGHVEKSLHIVKLQNAGDSMRHYTDLPMPTQRNIGPERNGLRLSFHVYHDDIPKLTYNALDPHGQYTVKLFAQRESPLEIDGQLAKKIRTGAQFDQVTEQEFEVPSQAVADGKLELTWAPLDQRHLNWRQKHYVTDIWILKRGP